jgi:RHS repeat-associated protein
VDGDLDNSTVKKYFYHTDHLGSTVAVSDESGQTVWTSEYTPFGDKHSVTGELAHAAKFTGKDLDEDTGLYYFNARWYDSEVGRFVTADTYTFLPGDERNFDETADKGFKILSEEPQRYNPYVFCTNSPVNRIDLDGHVGEAVIGPIVEKAGEVLVKAAIGVSSAVIAWVSGLGDVLKRAQHGKNRVRDSGLAGKSLDELEEAYNDPNTSAKEKQRIKKEQKALKVRKSRQTKDKRK